MSDPSDDQALMREIAMRAYVRFCHRGCAHGGDIDDWLEAEREVLESRKSETATDQWAIAKPRTGPKANRRRGDGGPAGQVRSVPWDVHDQSLARLDLGSALMATSLFVALD